jgi:GNAT superfamily N-acetyltransferase
MTIRVREPEDMDRCIALLAAVHATDGYPLHWPADPRAWLTPTSLLAAWVAEHGGMVAGHVALCAVTGDAGAPLWSAASGIPAEGLGAVTRLFVSLEVRGRQLGAALLDEATAGARSRGLLPVLEVLDHDRAAMALYERIGWRRVASAPAAWAQGSGGRPLLHYYLAPE